MSPEPSWIKKLPTRIKSNISPEDVNGGYYYLLMDQQYEVAKEELYYHNVYKFTTEEGVQDFSELRVSYDPNHEKLQFHKVVVWRNGKPINKLDLKKIKLLQRERGMDRGIYDENLTAVLVLDDIRVGDIVEYSCTVKGANPVFAGKFFNSFNLQSYDPMDERLVHIVMPQNRRLNYKLHLTDKKPAIGTTNGSTTYTWHLKDLPATLVDDETPSWFDPYPGAYVSEFNTWQEVVNWALPLYEVNEKLSKDLQAKIDKIKSAYGSDEDRLTAALQFVQDEVRYLGFEAGIGGFKPRSPSHVFANRFGDCKDKALLLAVMLRQMDIKAFPALVNSSYQGHIAEMLPSPYAFNHCIVQVELLGGKTYWYDATISKQRGDFKSIYLPNYGKALLIKPQSNALTTVIPPIVTTPHVNVKEIYYVTSFDDVTMEVRTAYTGAEADFQRSHFSTTSIKDIEKNYLNFYANSFPEIELAEDISYEDASAENTFTVIEKYNIPNFWQSQKNNDKVIEAWFTPQVLRSYIRQPQTTKRTMPLALRYPLHIEHNIKVLLPEAWSVNNEDQTIEDDAFTFRKDIMYSSTGTELEINYTYKAKQDHVATKAVAQYLRNQKSMLDELSYGLTYNKDIAADSGTSWPIVLLAIVAFGLAAFGANKLYFWDPQPAAGYSILDGEPIGGWLILVAIGLVFTPIKLLIGFFSEEYFNNAVWSNILDASSAAYSPPLAGILAMEIVVNMAYFVYSLLLIYLFFKRRTSIPRLMTIFYSFNLAFIIFEYMLMELLNIPYGNGGNDASDVIRVFVAAAIWVPYFNLSKRVRSTFTERLNPKPETEVQQRVIEEEQVL
ncbi:DUF3857 domain-containing protein [Microvirga sp. STS03]|nr:DUF3857 domain-containing protein [Microvirga sp. STS03]